jgi:hypothetical protein
VSREVGVKRSRCQEKSVSREVGVRSFFSPKSKRAGVRSFFFPEIKEGRGQTKRAERAGIRPGSWFFFDQGLASAFFVIAR